jgi:hypothetical protein
MLANGLTIAHTFYGEESFEVLIFVGVAINVPPGSPEAGNLGSTFRRSVGFHMALGSRSSQPQFHTTYGRKLGV